MHPNRYLALIMAGCLLFAQAAQSMPPPTGATAAEQDLDKLLAPVALYPDSLLAQVLACATSPDQLTEVNKWLEQNKNLQGTQLQDAANAKGFDASFIAMVLFPDVLTLMGKNIEWTTEVGKAFLSDQKGVLDSVQRLRAQAQAAGNLKTTAQQTVTTQKQDAQQVIVIQPANPQVVYVPVYDTKTVYSAPPPDNSGNVAAAALIGFGLGIAIAAAVHDDYYYGPYGWGGWGMHWHTHTVVVVGGPWRVPPHPRYPYVRPVPVPRGGVYRPRPNVYAPTYNNVNINVNRPTTINTARPAAYSNKARPTTYSNTARTTAQPAAAQRPATRTSNYRAPSYGSRGYTQPNASAATTQARTGTKSNAFSGYQNGSAERAASQRGRRSADRTKKR
ncbi:MAG TPA: DUF3300 domain-containing protein [Acidobacteriota bacterium]|nr:DUF3300 domain-containing protein [Acidobacteriota bacterium]